MSTHRKRILKSRDYLDHEEGTIYKSGRGAPAITLVYPNTYFLGMSNLGFQSLYALFNRDRETVCERAFLPDAVVLDQTVDESLRTLESGRFAGDCDCLALSISFENDYLYLLRILDMCDIPFYARERGEEDPIVLAGGAAITINPEPIADFCDALFIGEAEEAAEEIVAALRALGGRRAKLDALAKVEGIYLPSTTDFSGMAAPSESVCPSSRQSNTLETRVPLSFLRTYKRRAPRDINGFPVETVVHSDYSEFGKLSLIEVQRGCGRGCKFCAEGFIYTPFRQRDFGLVQEQVLRGLKRRGKIGLIGADLLVYPDIVNLMRYIHDNGGTFSPSSVRLDALTDEIIALLAKSSHKTLAVAPEAGSTELRRSINKKFDNASVLDAIGRVVSGGIPNIKMYLMIGLPGETARDIDALIELALSARREIIARTRASGIAGSLTVSLNPFIPKPRTPYQVGVYEGVEAITGKIDRIKKSLMTQGGIRLYYENPFFAYVQALLSNGTRHLGDYLMQVFKNGGGLRKSLQPFFFKRDARRVA